MVSVYAAGSFDSRIFMGGGTDEYLLLCLGYNVSQILYNPFDTSSMKDSLLGLFVSRDLSFSNNMIFSIEHLSEYAASSFFAFMLLMVLYYPMKRIQDIKNIKPAREQNKWINHIIMCLIYITTLSNEILYLIKYIE